MDIVTCGIVIFILTGCIVVYKIRKPKHTFKSISLKLIDGLKNGKYCLNKK